MILSKNKVVSNMDELIFLPDLISPRKIKKLKLPLEFVAFGYVSGKLFSHRRHAVLARMYGNPKGNSVVYGAIFLCKRFDYFSNVIDGMMGCSLSTLNINHRLDYSQRTIEKVVVIKFKNLHELATLQYKEVMALDVQVWYINPLHKDYKTLTYPHRRILDGIMAKDFCELYREVINGKKRT